MYIAVNTSQNVTRVRVPSGKSPTRPRSATVKSPGRACPAARPRSATTLTTPSTTLTTPAAETSETSSRRIRHDSYTISSEVQYWILEDLLYQVMILVKVTHPELCKYSSRLGRGLGGWCPHTPQGLWGTCRHLAQAAVPVGHWSEGGSSSGYK